MRDGPGDVRGPAESAAGGGEGAGGEAGGDASGDAGFRSRRPVEGEFAPFYDPYLSRLPDGDVTGTLERDGEALVALLRSVAPERETHAYADGKWSVREVAGHVIDAERLFTYRALHMARGDPAPLPDMDQERWAADSNAADRGLSELADELEAVRRATVRLFRGFTAEAWARTGVASEREVSVRALAWITAGHAAHHHRVLLERYGLGRA